MPPSFDWTPNRSGESCSPKETLRTPFDPVDGLSVRAMIHAAVGSQFSKVVTVY